MHGAAEGGVRQVVWQRGGQAIKSKTFVEGVSGKRYVSSVSGFRGLALQRTSKQEVSFAPW